jgi:thymidylate synthase
MMTIEEVYLDTLSTIVRAGSNRFDRTGVGTRSIFNKSISTYVGENIPLLTTKKVWYKGVLAELIWFIRGDTKLRYLLSEGVHIWTPWAFAKYQADVDKQLASPLTVEEFEDAVLNDDYINDKYSLGNVYGKQWRNFGGVDQLQLCIDGIKKDPHGRRHIVSAWNPAELNKMALPPCHILYQFYVDGDSLDMFVYQRSADWFLGVPFNLASYATLLHIVAKLTNKIPNLMHYTFGDCHVYNNHYEQVKEQLSREIIRDSFAKLKISDDLTSINKIHISQFELTGYKFHPAIKAPIAI